jgi:hypothetical protein
MDRQHTQQLSNQGLDARRNLGIAEDSD